RRERRRVELRARVSAVPLGGVQDRAARRRRDARRRRGDRGRRGRLGARCPLSSRRSTAVRITLVVVVALIGGCTHWQGYSSQYEGPGVCAAYVVAGDAHTCARKTNGSLECWGDNRYGQLGTGDLVRRERPTRIDLAGRGVSRIYAPVGDGEVGTDFGSF